MWPFKCAFCLKFFPHWSHVNRAIGSGLYLIWDNLWWFFIALRWINDLSHCLHFQGFSPVCTIVWPFKVFLCANVRSQSSHLNDFSPLWTSLCDSKCSFLLKDFSHLSHACAFRPLWINLCKFKLNIFVNKFPHISQGKDSVLFDDVSSSIAAKSWYLISQQPRSFIANNWEGIQKTKEKVDFWRRAENEEGNTFGVLGPQNDFGMPKITW